MRCDERTRKSAPIALATFAIAALWQAPAFAGDPAAAREQLKIGYSLAQEGKCEEAGPHLMESMRLDPRAITLINLADCEEKTGHLAEAMAHWADARSRAQSEGARPIEEEATKRAAALDPRLPRLTIVLAASAPKDATVERDGVALGAPSMNIPLPVDPGAHALIVKAKGHADVTTQVTLAEGEAKRVELDVGAAVLLPPPPPQGEPGKRSNDGSSPSSSLSPLVYIGFGAAAVGVAVGTATGIVALGKGNDAERMCPNQRCTDPAALSSVNDKLDSGRTVGWISTISFGVAVVGAGVGVYGLFFAPKKASEALKTDKTDSRGVAVSFAPTPGGAMIHGRF